VRHPVDVLKTIDGDTFEARVYLWPGLDLTTRVRLRGIDAAATRQTPNVSSALRSAGYVRDYDGGHRNGWCSGR
jgi:endonuclease YncB( thermonuclease family)